MSNVFYSIRKKIWTPSRTITWFKYRYYRRSLVGLLRGYFHSLLGRIIHSKHYRPIIIGSHIDFDLGSNSVIELIDENQKEKITDPNNVFFPNATSIGVYPHWEHMNLPTNSLTRLRIKENAKLLLDKNSVILVGCYIAIWKDQTLKIGSGSYIAHGVHINTRCGLTIGKNVMIEHETTIMDYDGHPIYQLTSDTKPDNAIYGGASEPITIEDNVWIGFRATILKGVTIGNGSIIGANSCVTTNIPPNSIAAGNPARVIKENIKWER